MSKRLAFLLLVAAFGLTALDAQALPLVSLNYNVTALGSDNFRFDYLLTNAAEPAGLNELIVFFNSSDQPGADFPPIDVGDPTDWTHAGLGAVIAPDPGHYSWAVDWVLDNPSDPGVQVGETLGGFSATVHWSNPDAPPGAQFFEAFGAGPNEGYSVLPEPNALVLMASGFGVLGLAGRLRFLRAKRREN